MIQEVKYNGYSASPSDYESLDGDLADVINLIPEDGALKPIVQPKAIFSYLEHDIVFVHETSEYTHYIGKGGNDLYWLLDGDQQSAKLIYDFGSSEILQVTAVGNTLVVLTSDGVKYALWSADKQAYTYLGEVPECPLSFGLKGELVRYSDLNYETKEKVHGRFKITFDRLNLSNDEEFYEPNQISVTNQVLAKVNRFVEEVSTNANKFMFPFFVRYAYRMYDDSLTMHSAPILMLPCTDANPHVFMKGYNTSGVGATESWADIYSIATELDYQALMTDAEKNTLSNWKDLIKSVDVFISAPIYTYDQSGKCMRFKYGLGHNPGRFIGKFTSKKGTHSGSNDKKSVELYYQGWDIDKLAYFDTMDLKQDDDTECPIAPAFPVVELPKFEDGGIEKKIRDCSSFFFLTSIALEDLSVNDRKKVEFEDGILKSLMNREVMTDDYQSHDTLLAKHAFGYNGRLNLSGMRRKMFKGYDLATMVAYVNGHNYFKDALSFTDSNFDSTKSRNGEYFAVYTRVKINGLTYWLRRKSITHISPDPFDITFLYYPDISADHITYYPTNEIGGEITDSQDSDNQHTLTPHDFLNGSYFFNLKGEYNDAQGVLNDSSDQAIENAPNKIYTSEVNNPFVFPLLGINAIGAGEVLGISTAAKALSQGQFGQFPLYAFTTEGVWALEVASNGSYIARQPITRDVCINPDSITQIDSAVLFATDRGIMLLSGSETMCITDILDSKEAFSLHSLPKGEDISAMVFNGYTESIFDRVPFKEYLKGVGMLYDYVHQRIIVFNPAYDYGYVYSLESKAWGMTIVDIAHAVPSYPNALAMGKSDKHFGNLYDYSMEDNIPSDRVLLVTRPLKLGSPDTLKTVGTIIQRGYFKKGHVQSVLYGSRDLFNWIPIASSKDHYLRGFRGTPYKYFRVVVIGDLEPKESIFGCTVQYEAKKLNQPR